MGHYRPMEEIKRLRTELATLRAENAELQRTFDMNWDAQMRAVERWREANPGNELVLPDTADLTLWLLERAEPAERLQGRALRKAREARMCQPGSDGWEEAQQAIAGALGLEWPPVPGREE